MPALRPPHVLAFFADFQQTQLRVWRECLDPSLRWIQLTRKKRALAPFVEDDFKRMVEVLHRPRRVDDAWFVRHGARGVAERTVYALQEADIGEPAVLLYTSAFLEPAGLQTRFAVTRVGQSLQLVSRSDWSEEGWAHVGGRFLDVASCGELQVLKPPADARSADILARLAG